MGLRRERNEEGRDRTVHRLVFAAVEEFVLLELAVDGGLRNLAVVPLLRLRTSRRNDFDRLGKGIYCLYLLFPRS